MLVSDCLFNVLNEKTDSSTVIKWILGDVDEDAFPEIKRSDFALYFLNYLQEQTSSVIKSCPLNRREDAQLIQKQDIKRSNSNNGNNNHISDDSVTQATVKRTPGHVRKIFTSPGDKTAAHSLKRVTPQSFEPFPYNQRNGLLLSPACYPGSDAFNDSLSLISAPMIFDPRLGYSVPYYGNRNYNNHYRHPQTNTAVGGFVNQNSPSNYKNVNSYFHDRNTNPNFMPLPQPHPNNFSTSVTSNPVSVNSVPCSPKKTSKGYQTPKTPKSNKTEPRTPNSGSSCSSGISLMSPESPLYSENFPAMGSNERRNSRRESARDSSECVDNNQSKKHSHNRKRIKPIKLNKAADKSGFQGEFGKPSSGDSCDKVPGKFPERKQNFFEKKVSPNHELLNIDLEKLNVTTPELEKSIDVKEVTELSSCSRLSFDDKLSPETKDMNYFQSSFKKIEDTQGESKISDDVSKNKDKSSPRKKSAKAKKCDTPPDPVKVSYPSYLMKLAEIYSALLDANLIPNVTAEVYFIFSLLTVDTNNKTKPKSKVNKSESSERQENTESLCDETKLVSSPSTDDSKSPEESVVDKSVAIEVKEEETTTRLNPQVSEADVKLLLFGSIHECVYFASAVLSRQRHFLAILDKATLKLLLENKRLSSFVPETVEYVKSLYDKKDKELRSRQQISLGTEEMSINPVPFQIELDNRDTFSSDPSFQVFRKQRDAFYEILQIWNEKHEKRDWKFNLLSSRIEKLFLMSTDPVNMRHLARHFCDLLLKTVSAKDNKTEEYSVSGMPEIDRSKLNRLTERLIRPSVSGQKDPRPSPDFPGLQAFYRDFLVVPAANYSFHTHVINCLAGQIDLLNGTSFQFEEPDINGQMVQEETRLAFLKCLQSLCVLAKFLGLVVFSPYRSSSEVPQSVLQDEISARNKILPPLDLQQYLVSAEDEGRLVQTVPWIVEYLGMMDAAAPLLTSYQTVLNTLFSLYLYTAPHLYSALTCVLSFGESSLINDANQLSGGSNSEIIDNKSDSGQMKKKLKLSWQTAVLLRLTIGWLFDTSNFSQSLFFSMASSYKGKLQQKEKLEEKWHNVTVDSSDIVDEKLLREFCPYLINLRVCLAESTNSGKQGPVRHVTPVPSQQTTSSKTLAAAALELQLEENFFMGQSESLRRTVEFVAERAASACIKHVCSNIVVSLKNSVLKQRASKRVVDLQPYIEKYNKSVEEEIESVIKQRLTIALTVLLGPDVIEQSLNNICQQIAARKLRERVINWLQSHINITEILTKLQMDGNGQSDMNNSSQNQNEKINRDCISFSEALILVQDLLNDVLDSRGNDGIKSSTELITIFKQLAATISYYHDSSLNIKLLLSLVLDYLLLIVTYRPEEVTSDVLEEFCKLWKLYNYPGPLSRLLSPRNIMLLVQGGPANSTLTWEKFGRIIVSVLTHDVLSISNLEGQAVAFFRHNWPDEILLCVSKCLSGILEDVRKHRACVNDPKFVLMLELCSDMAADMNDGLDELDF